LLALVTQPPLEKLWCCSFERSWQLLFGRCGFEWGGCDCGPDCGVWVRRRRIVPAAAAATSNDDENKHIILYREHNQENKLA